MILPVWRGGDVVVNRDVSRSAVRNLYGLLVRVVGRVEQHWNESCPNFVLEICACPCLCTITFNPLCYMSLAL